MAYAPTAIYAWLAQHNDEKALAGGAFLLAPDIAVTCAHVVRDHLGLGVSNPPPGLDIPISLNFPALDIKRQAHVVPNGWIEVEVEGGADVLRDVALLRLTEPVKVDGFGCVPLATSPPPGGGLARIWGAGPGWQATGQEVEVKLGQCLNHTGRRQLTNRDGHGFTTKQGFSGSPLFDDHMTVIWGMVQQVAPQGERVTLALGADSLQEALRRAGLSPASSAGKPQRERPRKSREKRVQEVKRHIRDALTLAPDVMGLLEKDEGVRPFLAGKDSESRASALCDALMKMKFDDALAALQSVWDETRYDKKGSAKAVAKITGWLLPWLYVVSNSIRTEPWETISMASVIEIPVGLTCFTEIVMAGLDVRPPNYDTSESAQEWPQSPHGMRVGYVEEGISEPSINIIRTELMKKLAAPPDIHNKNTDIQDKSINIQIDNLLIKQNVRTYVLYSPSDRDSDIMYKALLREISANYPGLGVVVLSGDLISDQRYFNDIRDLLMLDQDDDA